jgi:hypothetical protein
MTAMMLRQVLAQTGLLGYARQTRTAARVLLQNTRARFITEAPMSPHRLVFIAGMPKSGTTWLENLVGAVPGYRKLACYDPRGLLYEHVLDPVVFEHLPVRGNFFIKTHVGASESGVNALQQHKVPTVVMVRDLRDQCVSRFYHVLSQPTHRHYDFYKSAERAKAFSHCVEVTATEYADWCRGWLRAIQADPSLFIVVRYEDVRRDVKSEFVRVLDHFDIALSVDTAEGLIAEVAARANEGTPFEERLRKGNTLRGGRIGDWRTHFSAADVEEFKRLANDVLVALGYEADAAWRLG